MMEDVTVLIRRLDPNVPLPKYAHPGDAGADLVATKAVELVPGARALVPTGISLALPPGFVALVHPRSGLAIKHGITLPNAPGTIDAGYRGEVQVALVNLDHHQAYTVKVGERIAQLVIQRVARAEFLEVAELPDSHRGQGGFGSSGI